MKPIIVWSTLLLLVFVAQTKGQPAHFKKTDEAAIVFVSQLMSKMTLEEKIGQMNLVNIYDVFNKRITDTSVFAKIRAGGVTGMFNLDDVELINKIQKIAVTESRLKIPLLFGMDVIHGYKTIFPVPLGLASTWDVGLIEQSASIAAAEASANGIAWTFSPMVDIARDPRWGRVVEGAGEDPYLGGAVAAAMVRGYQGNYSDRNVMACVKHFAGYGASEAGLDYMNTDFSMHRLYNEYLPPYQAAVDAGVASVMTSYQDINGLPATASKWMVNDLLKKDWGFRGFVVTDYAAIANMTLQGLGNITTVVPLALHAGIDMDMASESFYTYLKKIAEAEKNNRSIHEINTAVKKILLAKYQIGLFKNPYRTGNVANAQKEVYSAANLAAARNIAANSFVLLKNANHTLPLSNKKSIALIGPLAKEKGNMVGTWTFAAEPGRSVSLFEGLTAALTTQNVQINYAKGSNLVEDTGFYRKINFFGKDVSIDPRPATTMIAEAVAKANQSELVLLAIGESAEMSGESASRTRIDIPQVQIDLYNALLATGKPIVVVLFTGRPLTIAHLNNTAQAILNVWNGGGTEGGHAIADVLLGKANPSGKLTHTWPLYLGQVPIYYNHKASPKPAPDSNFLKYAMNYLDAPLTPLYPFGYGLSYSQFKYSNLRLSSKKINNKPTSSITVSIDITNTSTVAGKEIVQLYIQDVVGSSSRPIKELKGFKKIDLAAGQTQNIQFTISLNDLKFYNQQLQWVAEPGLFNLYVGGNSEDVLKDSFELEKK